MEPEAKNLFIRVLELATGITAVTTVVVLSSVAGMSAYIAYQPSALEAQAISVSVQTASATSTQSTACQQEIATAAARGYPDSENVITGGSNAPIGGQCVAAILTAAATSSNAADPDDYTCVGESATIDVSALGLVTETTFPDPALPAGTCNAITCTSYGAGGQSNCVSANGTSAGTILQGATISPDSQNIDLASIPVTTGTAGQANPANISSEAPLSSLGQTQAVAPEPPQTPQTLELTPPPVPAEATSTVVATATAPSPAVQPQPVPETSAVVPPEEIAGPSSSTVPSQLPNPQFNVPQPTTPVLVNSGDQSGTVQPSPNPTPETAPATEAAPDPFAQIVGTVQNESSALLDRIRSLFGL